MKRPSTAGSFGSIMGVHSLGLGEFERERLSSRGYFGNSGLENRRSTQNEEEFSFGQPISHREPMSRSSLTNFGMETSHFGQELMGRASGNRKLKGSFFERENSASVPQDSLPFSMFLDSGHFKKKASGIAQDLLKGFTDAPHYSSIGKRQESRSSAEVEVAKMEIERLSSELVSKDQAINELSAELVRVKRRLAEHEASRIENELLSARLESMKSSKEEAKRGVSLELRPSFQEEMSLLQSKHAVEMEELFQQNKIALENLEITKNTQIIRLQSELNELKSLQNYSERTKSPEEISDARKSQETIWQKDLEIKELQMNLKSIEEHVQSKIREEFLKKNERIREMEQALQRLEAERDAQAQKNQKEMESYDSLVEKNRKLEEKLGVLKEELEIRSKETEKLREMLREKTRTSEEVQNTKNSLEAECFELRKQVETTNELMKNLRNEKMERVPQRESGASRNPEDLLQDKRGFLSKRIGFNAHHHHDSEPELHPKSPLINSKGSPISENLEHSLEEMNCCCRLEEPNRDSWLSLVHENETLKASLHNYASKLKESSHFLS